MSNNKKKYYNPIFELPKKVSQADNISSLFPDMEICSGDSLTRVIRTNDNNPNISGKIKLLSQIGQRGGEGTVYQCNLQNKVCKIYHKDKITRLRLHKLVVMQAKKIKIDGVCYPEDLLYNEYKGKKQFCGYLMSEAKGHKLQTSVMHPMVIRDKFPNWTREHLVELCLSILRIVEKLHKSNIIIGDLNPNNILVANYNKVYFIDCDSFQIGPYPCPVGMPYFTPREIQGKKYSKFLRTKEHDMFAVTTLFFMILFLGKPPYACRGGGNPAENIKKGNFPYKFKDRRGEDTPDGPWKFIWNNLPQKLKEIFNDCFADNKKPSIKDLQTVLCAYKSNLKKGYNSNELLPTKYKKIPNKILKKYGK